MGGNPNYEDALRRMSKVVNTLMARADCSPFREPVDWREMELYDYPKIIKKVRNNVLCVMCDALLNAGRYLLSLSL